jgi:hypothetical protein
MPILNHLAHDNDGRRGRAAMPIMDGDARDASSGLSLSAHPGFCLLPDLWACLFFISICFYYPHSLLLCYAYLPVLLTSGSSSWLAGSKSRNSQTLCRRPIHPCRFLVVFLPFLSRMPVVFGHPYRMPTLHIPLHGPWTHCWMRRPADIAPSGASILAS